MPNICLAHHSFSYFPTFQVLFGAIANTDHLMSNTSRLTQAGRQEQHNVLALYTSSHTRFPLLPVVSEQAKSTLAQAITPAEKVCATMELLSQDHLFSLVTCAPGRRWVGPRQSPPQCFQVLSGSGKSGPHYYLLLFPSMQATNSFLPVQNR